MSQVSITLPTEQPWPNVTATELKNKIGPTVALAEQSQNGVVVTVRGMPRVAMLSFEDYKNYLGLREKQRRNEAIAELRKLKHEVCKQNRDITEQQTQELADQFTREVIKEMVTEGKIKYE